MTSLFEQNYLDGGSRKLPATPRVGSVRASERERAHARERESKGASERKRKLARERAREQERERARESASEQKRKRARPRERESKGARESARERAREQESKRERDSFAVEALPRVDPRPRSLVRHQPRVMLLRSTTPCRMTGVTLHSIPSCEPQFPNAGAASCTLPLCPVSPDPQSRTALERLWHI